jgi:cell division protein FtsB
VTRPEAPVRSDSFRPVLGVTALLVFALLAVAALKSSRDLEAARARERLLRTQIAATRASSEHLRVRIERLRHDPGMLERLAREDLGMVRPQDVVVELPAVSENPANPAPHPPAPSPVPSRPPSPGEGERADLKTGTAVIPAAATAATGGPAGPPGSAVPAAAPHGRG